MGQKILRLSEEEINKIAAGEVVENPASIVKELIENSLDAGSKRIEVTIQKGGHELIVIDDDGYGMEREDAELSIERHATSKIRTAKDLETLASMGFRGEALAAISAVSDFEMRTSTSELGTQLLIPFGKVEKITSIARRRGTTVYVRSLFHRLPARKKFLKSQASSTRQIVKIVETLAMAYPQTFFILRSNGQTLLSLEPQEKRKRIEAILGPFEREFKGQGIWGLLGSASEASFERKRQYTYVNDRAVFSPLLAKAIQLGYGTRLFEGLYPSFILFLNLPPEEFDVNIHPQKKEVRFVFESKVFEKVKKTVEHALEALPERETAPTFSSREEMRLSEAYEMAPFAYRVQFPEQTELQFQFSLRSLYLKDSFFLFEKGGLFLMDLVRAEKRILFEAAQKKEALKELSTPLTITVEDEEIASQTLEELGVEGRAIGKKIILVETIFDGCLPGNFSEFFFCYQKYKKLDKAISQMQTFSKTNYTTDLATQICVNLEKCREKEVDPTGQRIFKKLESIDFMRILGSGK